MQDTKDFDWANDYDAESQEETENSKREADLQSNGSSEASHS